MIALTRRSLSVLILLVALTVLALTAGARSVPAASSYKTCSLSERDQDPPGVKPTYNLSLKRIGASCATAKKVMNAFHACRSRSAVGCTKRVLTRWTCSSKKDSSAGQIFYATFTCKNGTQRVKSTFQQNT